ncbi:XdhC family protein [Fibrisoma montanum]|uniref:XdhC family protein n=2 Tax=Fibrisoma montanum TaxID=2305895 RepID=A0A418M0E1_9BACT|nr:XdhC family protein [Fibrisoma montanum]
MPGPQQPLIPNHLWIVLCLVNFRIELRGAARLIRRTTRMISEFRHIIDTYRQVDFTQRKAALATVVGLKGSGYRRPGARMLITDDGHWTGAISGGCLEGDALRKAREVMQSGQSRLVTYDTTQPDGENFGIGLGCHGILDVLIEPLTPTDTQNSLEVLDQILQNRREVELSKPLPNGDFFTEQLRPDIQLLVFGAGYDAVPLVAQAKLVGWHVVVADDCVAHLNPRRFAQADQLLAIQRDNFRQSVTIDSYSAAVLISHNYKFDRSVLRELLQTDIRYIGILGPKKRGDALLDELADVVQPSDHDRIFAPVGLDVGAETPTEIALSIVSEVQAVFRQTSARPLKFKNAPIHQPVAQPTPIES